MKRLVILISDTGTGTNLKAIIAAIHKKIIDAEIVCIISDAKDAQGVAIARKNNIVVDIVSKKEDLFPALQKYNPTYICLSGWKQFITDEVIDFYENKILNLHPGLVPDKKNGFVKNPDGSRGEWNKGKLTTVAIKNILDSKNSYAGSSIHFLSHEFDYGIVLGRCYEKVKKGDTIEALYKRLKLKENKLYVSVLTNLCRQDMKKKNTVLVIDAGGRGAALVQKYAQSPYVSHLLAVPGNELMQINSKKPVKIFPHLKTTSIQEIVAICKKEKVDLVDVAQDNAVEVGLTDALLKNGFKVSGPTRDAGQIEWDKAWSRDFMKKYKIPHPGYHVCHSEKEGISFLHKQKNAAWFIKAAGLAEGKGVIPAKDNAEAILAIKNMKKFGASGDTFLIEEALVGEEFSLFAVSDGKDYKIIGSAQDHKRLLNFDEGPNTGGMGCVSSPRILTKKLIQEIDTKIVKPTLLGMKNEGRAYTGILYVGGMLVASKPYVIEFNARWGDPEAEVIVPNIQSDFFLLNRAVAEQSLSKVSIKTDTKIRVSIALSLRPDPYGTASKKGRKIFGLEKVFNMKGITVFGTRVTKEGKQYFVSSGRLLYIVGEGKNVAEAREKAYHAAAQIYIEGNNLHYRTDIGFRDMERMYNST